MGLRLGSEGYITYEDIINEGFLSRPSTLILEAGNGFGKTHSSCALSTLLQSMRRFERIYILQYSQRGCGNVISKLERMGGFAVWHQGIDRVCSNKALLEEVRSLGLPPSYTCFLCPYFQRKSRLAFMVVKDAIESGSEKVISPGLVKAGLDSSIEVCTQPIIRAVVLNPSTEVYRRIRFPNPPIFVMPSQLLLNHTIVGRWLEYSRRQRRARRCLMIADEADAIFYSALSIEVPYLTFSKFDRRILEEFSTTRKRLAKLLEFYGELTSLFRRIQSRLGMVGKADVKEFREIVGRAEPLVRAVERRRKAIVNYVIKAGEPTNVFRLVSIFSDLTHVINPAKTLETVEPCSKGFTLEDYDFAILALLDNSFPWKTFWKILLTATFPTEKVSESRFLSIKSKAVLQVASRRYKRYSNVYVTFYRLFDDDGMVNRNKDLPLVVPKLIRMIRDVRRKYIELFKAEPNGICLWFGNSKQMQAFLHFLSRAGLKVVDRGKYALVRRGWLNLFVSYAGSAVSRGIDLNQYDISCMLAPLLRPPRNLCVLDVIDFARGVAEAIQSAMRVVRSPRPAKPKLIVIEKTMTKAFYALFYPDWFKALVLESFVE